MWTLDSKPSPYCIDSARIRRTGSAVLMFLAVWLLSSCSTPSREPVEAYSAAQWQSQQLDCKPYQQWISTLPIEDGLIYAVGAAETNHQSLATAFQRARETARAEIAKQLMVRIDASTELSGERRKTVSGIRYSGTFREQVNSQATEVELPGVAIVEQCVDRPKSTVFVLAKLNQAKAIDGFMQQLDQVDREISEYQSVPPDAIKTDQLRQLSPAFALLDKRKTLADAVTVLSGYRPPIPATNLALEKRMAALLDSITIGLIPKGQGAEEMTPNLASALANNGLAIDSTGSEDLLLTYQLNTRMQVDSGIYFVYAKADLTIENQRGAVVDVLQEQTKAGSPVSSAHAYDKALAEIGTKLGDRVAGALLSGF